MIPDKDHFVLLKTIKGIKDNVDKMYTLGNDDTQYVRDQFSVYLRQLTEVVNELHKDEIRNAA
jgi:hypothetical protein